MVAVTQEMELVYSHWKVAGSIPSSSSVLEQGTQKNDIDAAYLPCVMYSI